MWPGTVHILCICLIVCAGVSLSKLIAIVLDEEYCRWDIVREN